MTIVTRVATVMNKDQNNNTTRRIVVDQNPDGRDIYFDGRKYYYYPIESNKLMEAMTLKDAKKGYFKRV